MRKFQYNKKLLLFLLLFVALVLPSVVASYFSYTQLSSQLTEQTYEERRALAQQMAKTVQSRLDAVRDVGKASAGDIVDFAQEDDWEGAVNEISHISTEFPYIDRIFLSDLIGRTVAYYPPSPENVNKDFSFRDWYKGVSKNWEPYASEVFKRAPYPQFNTVAMMSPIKDDNGTVYGAVGFAINLDSFYALTEDFTVGKGGFLYIVNQKGQIVAHPKYPSQGEIIDYSSVPVVQKLLRGESGVEVAYNPVEKEERLAAYEKVSGYDWGVVVADPLASAFVERDSILQRSRFVSLLFISLNVALAAAIVFALMRLQTSREVMRQSNERFEFVSKATQDAIYDWNIETNDLYFGDGMYTLFGYSPEQVVQTLDWWSGQLHPEDRDRINTQLDAALKGSEDSFQLEYRFKKADGGYAEVIDRAYLVRNSSGKPVRYIGVMQDVTERKHYEQELKKRTDEAERLNKITVDRELQMIELKNELKKLRGDSHA